MKKDILLNKANRLINHGPLLLISSSFENKNNIFTAAWNMPVNHTPVQVAVSSSKKNYSTDLIRQSREFIMNIPQESLLTAAVNCGKVHGVNIDKFRENNLTAVQARMIHAPVIKECAGHLECIVKNEIELIDHILFIAEVVSAYAEEDLWDFREDVWKVPEACILHHLGGPNFCLTSAVK